MYVKYLMKTVLFLFDFVERTERKKLSNRTKLDIPKLQLSFEIGFLYATNKLFQSTID